MTLTTTASILAVILSVVALVGYALSAGRLLERLSVLTTTVQELRSELRSIETLRAADQRHDSSDTEMRRRIEALESSREEDRITINDLVQRNARVEALIEGATRGVPAQHT